MKAPIDKTRAHLGELACLADRTEHTERRILKQAEKRHGEVLADIGKLRPGIEAKSDDEQQRYLDLVAERGQLDQVIARARKALEN